jgi:alpha-tubulin suppressor-like RCC1 family protein
MPITDGASSATDGAPEAGLIDGSNDPQSPEAGVGPTDAGNDTNVTQVAIGLRFSCALSNGGDVKCWGQDSYGSLGRGSLGTDITDPLSASVLDFGTSRRVTQITAGNYHACALFEDGKARCWGRNDSGQLGQGTQQDYGDEANEQLNALQDIALSNITSIEAGSFGTCALAGNPGSESLYCWGSNTLGELGIGDTQMLTAPQGPAVLAAQPKSMIAGARWVCAHLSTNDARCWGNYNWGVLGVGTIDFPIGDGEGDGAGEGALPNDSAYNVKGLPGPVTTLAGDHITMCALSLGSVYCWGRNSEGRAGYPVATYGDELWQPPRAVNLGNVTISQISSTHSHGCAVDDEGIVRCWGSAPQEGLGYPGVGRVGEMRDPIDDYELMRIAGDGGADAGDAGSDLPLGAIDLGDFDGTPGLDPATAVFTGFGVTCAAMQTGGLRCWGDNTWGRLGYGTALPNIGLTQTPAEAYEQMGFSDIKVFSSSE